jgi:hypothetical protein
MIIIIIIRIIIIIYKKTIEKTNQEKRQAQSKKLNKNKYCIYICCTGICKAKITYSDSTIIS